MVDFVNGCLVKETKLRPNFDKLSRHSFFQKHNTHDPVVLATERAFFGDYVASFIPDGEN